MKIMMDNCDIYNYSYFTISICRFFAILRFSNTPLERPTETASRASTVASNNWHLSLNSVVHDISLNPWQTFNINSFGSASRISRNVAIYMMTV